MDFRLLGRRRTVSCKAIATLGLFAGFSEVKGAQMSLTASVLEETGGLFIQASRTGPADRPRELGRAVGLDLLAKGAANIIERSRPK